ncbi:MAG TPA: hypothetical protein PLG33_08385 [Prolixibacteraceae bacterium]|nr:hypothetical protein [Prolixibacteraceae bacterium]HPR86056.1 hypothetical protein [Prolixibacteraceae bacterium]
MATNIRFHYQHRDSGNYKKFGHRDFSNPENLTIEEAEKQIRQQLIDGEFFYPEQVGIPKFRFHRYLDDYSWYEFCELELVEGRRSKETFAELVEKLKQ